MENEVTYLRCSKDPSPISLLWFPSVQNRLHLKSFLSPVLLSYDCQ